MTLGGLMSTHRSRWLRALAALALAAAPLSSRAQGPEEQAAPPAGAPSAAPAGESGAAPATAADLDRTPPRLSFTDGEVSFWRSGAPDWSPAQVNTPLGENDQLYTGDKANLEVQVGARAFVRAGEQTQLGVTNLEPDFVQFRIVAGHASLDLRSVKAGLTIEIDTPHAAFSVEHPGYYRIEVTDESTSFTSRRGGRATVTPANGQAASVAPSEQVVVTGTDQPQLETYAAPELDDWDRWNYTRTDQLLDAVSSRYVPYGVYGADDLDHYGDWRVVPTYGAVWMPRVAPGWVPYSTGSWVYDPYYGWTWVDTAPWGWAPFHYGRWVQAGGYWGWAPGPLVARPFYSPALVAFYDGPSFSIGISFGHANMGWVALGWGEPCVPWWGPSSWRGHPHWNGWGGPRVVNNVTINNKTVINVNEVHGWANASYKGAVVGVPRDQFGHGRVKVEHFDPQRVAKFRPVQGDLDVKPASASLAPSTDRGTRPPRAVAERTVVATREPKRGGSASFERTAAPTSDGVQHAQRGAEHAPAREQSQETAPRIVAAPKRGHVDAMQNRPPFGTASTAEREAPPKPPRYGDVRDRGGEATPPAPPPMEQAQRSRNQPADQRGAAPPPVPHGKHGESQARESTPQAPRNLPGEPANRVYRPHGQGGGGPHAEPAPKAESHSRGGQGPAPSSTQHGHSEQSGGHGQGHEHPN
ncbi:MAG: DUF6600 domain-containing protein [Myxococcota bacterium]